MPSARWNPERPPPYSRPRLRIAAGFSGVVGSFGMIPVIMMSRSNPRVMIAYVIVDFLVLGVVGALTIRFMRRLKARLRLAKGALCPDCGYDIRGLAETGDCPECGRPFERKADVAYWRRHVSF